MKRAYYTVVDDKGCYLSGDEFVNKYHSAQHFTDSEISAMLMMIRKHHYNIEPLNHALLIH